MKLGKNAITLRGPEGQIRVIRNAHGIPEISASGASDCAYALGWIHACDRQLQIFFTRILLQGRTAEILAGEPELVAVDRYMRRMNFLPDADREIQKLKPAVKAQLKAYADGINDFMRENGPVMEFRLLKHAPEPWEIKDSILIAKIMGFFGQTDAQAALEKFLVQMIQKGIDEKRVRELFPYLTDRIDVKQLSQVKLMEPMVPETVPWTSLLPSFKASNNWVLAGTRTSSGNAVLCNDPHLDVGRLPSIWQEIVMRVPDNYMMGVSVPGFPGLVIGRTKDVSWGTTFAYGDMIDFHVEHCRDGKYRRGTVWKPFTVREEVIKVKNGDPVIEKVYENELGVLEGEPAGECYLLVQNWAGAKGCGADLFNASLEILKVKTVPDMIRLFRGIEVFSLSQVVADRRGNIGYQMTGRQFRRPKGVSGLLPVPAWDAKFEYRGFIDREQFPTAMNPPEGFIITANNDLNHLGKSNPINLCMGSYRADRISHLVRERKKVSIGDNKVIQYDLYSEQAAKFMEIIRPLLPRTRKAQILSSWDCMYSTDSRGATLFEAVYESLIRAVFGNGGLGMETVAHLLRETSLFAEYYANFDSILLKKHSAWFDGRDRDDIFRAAIEEGLREKAVPYGVRRRITMKHLLFGDKFPTFLGFNHGPIKLPGGRATIVQGQIFRSAGRVMSFSPSYRLITDMGTDEIHTNLPGGPSDRRFSKWYTTDVKNWLKGVYKILR